MKRLLYILVILLTCTGIWAQGAEKTDSTDLLRTDVLYLHYGGEWLADSYLSPLLYDGWTIGIGNEWWTDFRKQTHQAYRWRHIGNLQGFGGNTVQSQKHNVIGFFGFQGGWGAHPVWQFETGPSAGIQNSCVKLYAGPYLGADFMLKSLSTNVNKPLSFDLGLDLNLMVGASYAFRCRKTAYRLLYEGRINVLGAMWLPDYWESYYEITEKVNLDGSICFSHPGNRQFLRQQIAMDFEFIRSTWRLGVIHEYQHYGDQKRHFARQSVALSVGCIFNYKLTKTKL